jgi:hypothetical protein
MNSIYFPKLVIHPTLNDVDLSNILGDLTEQPVDELLGDLLAIDTIHDDIPLEDSDYQRMMKYYGFSRNYIDNVYYLSKHNFWEKFRTGTFDYFEKKELIVDGDVESLYMEGMYNVGLRRTLTQYSDDYKIWILQNKDLLRYYSNIELLMFSPFDENDIENDVIKEQFVQLKNQVLFMRSSIILWNQRCDFLSFLHDFKQHDKINVSKVLNDPFFKREICQWL